MFFFTSFSILVSSFVVGAIVAFVVGSLWYADFAFGKIWKKELRVSEQELQDPMYHQKLKRAMIIVPILFGLFAVIFASLYHSLTFVSLWHAAWSGIVLWFGFISIPYLVSMNYKPNTNWKMFLVDAGMYLVLFIIFAVICYFVSPLWYV